MRPFNLLVIHVVTTLVLACLPGLLAAAELPDVVRHEAQYLDGVVSVTVEWQSANPVTKVRVTAGREQKETPVDEFDNRRNPQGYQGEVTVQVPLYQQSGQGAIPYIIQLEDDTRQRSALVNGSITVPVASVSSPYAPPPRDDNWGRENIRTGMVLGPQTPGEARAGDMIDKLLVVMDRFDTAPGIDEIKVNLHGPNNVSFSTKASDDKGLREVRFRVVDGRGLLVGFQSLTNLGKVWQGTSQTFVLGGGSFRVIAQAIDSAGNTSKEQSATFTLAGEPRELPQLQETGAITPGSGSLQTPAVYPRQETVPAFAQPLPSSQQVPSPDQGVPSSMPSPTPYGVTPVPDLPPVAPQPVPLPPSVTMPEPVPVPDPSVGTTNTLPPPAR
jgi:hypothetical protein